MWKYIIVRIIWMFIIFFTFMSLLFIILRLTEIYEYSSFYKHLSFSEKLMPIIRDYITWLKRIIIKWDWGLSTRVKLNESVFDLIVPRFPVTIKINLIAYLLYVPLGFVLGITSALNKNKIIDNIISIFVMIFSSLPSFVFIFLLMLFFGYYLDWFPTIYPTKLADNYTNLKGLVLPIIAISVEPIAYFSRILRGELTESMTSEYMILAKTKGLTNKQAIYRHALRVALIPVLTSIVYSFAAIIAGSFIIEIIYAIPGMGLLYYNAIMSRDYNLIMAITAIYTILMLLASLIVDLLYALIDPRIRIGIKKNEYI